MTQHTNRVPSKFFLLVLSVAVTFFSVVGSVHATTIASYDFNTAGDLATHFTPDFNNTFTESLTGGINDSGSISVDTLTGMYTGKYAMTNVAIGDTFTISGYFYNDGTSGYGGMGFITDTSDDPDNGIPLDSHGFGMYAHGGGGGFISDATDVDTLSWSGGDMDNQQWYKLVFSYTRTATNDYDLSIQIWNANSDGTLASKKTEHTFSVTNANMGSAGTVYPYFLTSGSDRFVTVDNIEVTDVPSVTPPPPFSGTGSGSEIDPYMIVTCSQLQEMENNLGSSYELASDIDCSETNPDDGDFDSNETWADGKGFRPVGDDQTPFTGNFDGNEHSITGLFVDRADDSLGEGVDDESYVGIFGYTSGSGILDLDVFDSKVKGYTYVGGIVGYALNSDIQNVSFNTTTEDNSCDPGNCVWARFGSYGGGIVGYMDQGTISNVSTGGPVKGSGIIIGGIVGLMDKAILDGAISTSNIDGGESLGGIAGVANDSSINDAHASGNVLVVEEQNYGKQGSTGGGLVGYAEGSDFSNSDATGTVTGLNNIGGFAGYFLGGTTSDSFATGDVLGSSSFAGGFVGVSGCSATLSRVYATGNVTGNDYVGGFSGMDGCEGPGATFNEAFSSGDVSGHDYVGGFFGQSYSSTVNDGYSTSNVAGNNYVAGFAGYTASSIFNNVYSSGTITAAGDSYLGGLIGENVSDQVEITNSFWNGDKTSLTLTCGNGTACAGATKSTTALMNTESTFTDVTWDFEDIWKMDTSNSGYPYFLWQEFEVITIDLDSASDIQKDSASLRMTINANNIKEYGFVLGTSSNSDFVMNELSEQSFGELALNYPTFLGDDFSDTDSFPFVFEHTFTELVCGTDYYYRAIAFNDNGTVFTLTPESSFTTLSCNDSKSKKIKSGSYSAKAFVAVQNNKAPVTTPTQPAPFSEKGQCPADQIINENLKAPSRNSYFNSYTGKKVSEANRLQAHLNRLGFNAGPVDGIIGPLSTAAIKRMQTFLGTPADGFVGPLTRALINNSCGNKANS